MKRLFCTLLILTVALSLFFLCSAGTAFAEAHDAVFAMTKTLEGRTLTVRVSLEDNDGIAYVALRLEYDAASLELTSRTYGSALTAIDQDTVVDSFQEEDAIPGKYVLLVGPSLTNVNREGEFLTLVFTVKNTVRNGEYAVALYVFELDYYAGGNNWVSNQKYATGASSDEQRVKGGVKVAEEHYQITDGIPARASKGSQALVIALSVVGAVLVVGGIIVVAYVMNGRKKKAQKGR